MWAALLPLPVKSLESWKLLLALWKPGLARLFSPAPQPLFLCGPLAFLKLGPFPHPLCSSHYSSPAPSIPAHPPWSVCSALVQRTEGYLVILLASWVLDWSARGDPTERAACGADPAEQRAGLGRETTCRDRLA